MVMLLDTSVWIELFQETENTKKIQDVLRTEDNFTSLVTLAEIVNWCFKNNLEEKAEDYVAGIKRGSQILDLNESIAVLGGRVNFDRKKKIRNWSMADSLIVATSFFHNLKILTKDSQFKDLPNVEML